MTRRACCIALTLLCLALASPAFASGRVVYRLGLAPPAEVLKAQSEGKNAYANIVAERLQRRFKAAAVKDAELRVATPSTVLVETSWGHSRGWLEALMTSPGRVEVRRVTSTGVRWVDVASTIPDGIELRGEDAPYLWAAKRGTLSTFVRRFSTPSGYVTIFPEDGGFRSVTLGELVADQRQVRSARTQQSSTGTPFVEIHWEASVAASLAASHVSDVERVAIVLDGELVAFAAAKLFLDHVPTRIAAPDEVVGGDRQARDLWVRQVAGRLAASMPVPIVVLKE